MNRRELLLGTLLAPLVKPVVALLPAKPVVEMGAAIYKPWINQSAIIAEACRRANAHIEDQIVNGYDPEPKGKA